MNNATPTPDEFRSFYAGLIDEHRTWLAGFDPLRLKRWSDQLDSQQAETALYEALVRRFLSQHVDGIEPVEDLSAGGPDYRCRKAGCAFYVECTCLTMEAVTRATGLTYLSRKACSYSLLTRQFHYACLEKAAQCSTRKDAPCLLSIGTLHAAASQLCFLDVELGHALTSEPKIAIDIDTRDGTPLGDSYETTDFRFAAFLAPRPGEPAAIEPVRLSISGLLLCGFGCEPPEVRGVINSHAKRPFDPGLLLDIEFGRIKESEGTVEVVWK